MANEKPMLKHWQWWSAVMGLGALMLVAYWQQPRDATGGFDYPTEAWWILRFGGALVLVGFAGILFCIDQDHWEGRVTNWICERWRWLVTIRPKFSLHGKFDQRQPPLLPPLPVQPIGVVVEPWLHDLLERNRRTFRENGYSSLVFSLEQSLTGNLEGLSAKYIDFNFGLINTSVFTLIVPSEIKGYVIWSNVQFAPDKLAVINPTQEVRDVPPGRQTVLTIRLWLETDQAGAILEAVRDHSMVNFNFNILEIWLSAKEEDLSFRYHPRDTFMVPNGWKRGGQDG